jgi:phenylacetate-CoA ligase
MRNERRSPEALREIQAAKLRRLTQHAYDNVSFYRRIMDQAGIKPADIQGPADLNLLPVIDKTTLLRQPLASILDDRLDPDSLVKKETSGSTGVPFRIYASPDLDRFCKAQALRPYLSNGLSVFQKTLRFGAYSKASSTWFQRLGLLRECRVSCEAKPQEMLDEFCRYRPSVLQGYPSALMVLVTEMQRQQAAFKPPAIVFTDSELLTPFDRRQLETTFRAPLFDVFGSWETDNVAYECDRHNGYHVAIDCVVVETILDGRSVPADEAGELVCTVLDNYAMPLIRYNLHDLVTCSTKQCDCGRGFPLMSVINGRTLDRIHLPDGRWQSPSALLARTLAFYDFAYRYQIVQETVTKFRFVVMPRRPLRQEDKTQIAAVLRMTHPEAEVIVDENGTIEKERSGKTRGFINRVGASDGRL